MPPIKIYETLQQSGPVDPAMMSRDGDKAGFDFLGNDDQASKKDAQSAMAGSEGKGSPQKSLAIKGPPKIISDKLEI